MAGDDYDYDAGGWLVDSGFNHLDERSWSKRLMVLVTDCWLQVVTQSARIARVVVEQELNRELPVDELNAAVLFKTNAIFVFLQVVALPEHEQVPEVVYEIQLAGGHGC